MLLQVKLHSMLRYQALNKMSAGDAQTMVIGTIDLWAPDTNPVPKECVIYCAHQWGEQELLHLEKIRDKRPHIPLLFVVTCPPVDYNDFGWQLRRLGIAWMSGDSLNNANNILCRLETAQEMAPRPKQTEEEKFDSI